MCAALTLAAIVCAAVLAGADLRIALGLSANLMVRATARLAARARRFAWGLTWFESRVDLERIGGPRLKTTASSER